MTLTDTQLILLSAASQRGDHGAEIPPNLKGGAAQKVVARLVAGGLLEEIRARAGLPVWRRDEDNVGFALRITRKGLKAIAVDDTPARTEAASEVKSKRPAGSSKGRRSGTAAQDAGSSKIDRVIGLLRRPTGASTAELIEQTGWLPHTARAALSGLRKAGHKLTRERDEAGGSRYKLLAKASGRNREE